MPAQGRLGDRSQCPADGHGCIGCAHSVIGPAVAGSPDVFVNGKPALRIGDPGIHSGCCGPNTWNAAKGSPSVIINGLPAHRQGDSVQHCGGMGNLVEGSPNVLTGEDSPPTHIPPVINPPTERYVTNLRWVKTPVRAGKPATMAFDYHGYRAGDVLRINIYEHDTNTAHDHVGRLDVKLPGGSGHHSVDWIREADDIKIELADEDWDEFEPANYFFKIRGEISQNFLQMLTSIVVEIVDEDGRPEKDGTEVTVTAADNTIFKEKVEQGFIHINEIVVGQFKVEIDEPNEETGVGELISV